MSYEAQLEVERELLASICQNPTFLDMWVGRLKSDLFVTPLGQAVFAPVTKLSEGGEDVTFASLAHEMGQGAIDSCGGVVEISTLFSRPAPPAMIRKWVGILEENMAKRRALAGAKIIQTLVESGESYKAIQPAVEQMIADMDIPQNEQTEFSAIGSVMSKVVDEIEVARKSEGRLLHPSTGITDLDEKIGGLAPNTFIVLHAKTSKGKSAFALQMLRSFCEQDAKALVFSYEMSNTRLSKRLLASISRVSLKNIIRGTLSGAEMASLENGIRKAMSLPIYFRENCVDMNINAIRREARRAKKQYGIGLVIVDYIQLVPPANLKDNRERQVAATSYGLQKMAQELEICVIGLAQVNDDGLLRESRAQAMDADIVLGLEGDDDDERTLRIHKNRDGELGKIDLTFEGKFQHFSPMI